MLDPPPPEFEELLERRRRLGLDGYDEVWEGIYYVAPMARQRHGWLQSQLDRILGPYADRAGLFGIGPFNLGDGPDNFRVPDLGYQRDLDPDRLYSPTAAAVVEVRSPGDETYDKFSFYAAHEVDEVLVIESDETRVHIFVRTGDRYDEGAASALLGVSAAEIEAALRWP